MRAVYHYWWRILDSYVTSHGCHVVYSLQATFSITVCLGQLSLLPLAGQEMSSNLPSVGHGVKLLRPTGAVVCLRAAPPAQCSLMAAISEVVKLRGRGQWRLGAEERRQMSVDGSKRIISG